MEFTTLNVLFLMAIALLLLVTSGVAYLTFADWRDRRRREKERRGQ